MLPTPPLIYPHNKPILQVRKLRLGEFKETCLHGKVQKTLNFLKSILKPGLPTLSTLLFPFPYHEVQSQGLGLSCLVGRP